MIRKIYKELVSWYNFILTIRFIILYRLNKIKKTEELENEKRELIQGKEKTFECNFNTLKEVKSKFSNSFPWGRHFILSENVSAIYSDWKNIKLDKGKCKFLVKDEEGVLPTWEGDFKYNVTGALLHTKDTFKQTYGVFEAKIKVSKNRRVWPAFWLLTDTWKLEYGEDEYEMIMPEIDIIEHFGGEEKKNKRMQFTYHSGLDYSDDTKIQFPTKIGTIPWDEDYYIYGISWDEKGIKWYVNDVLVKVLHFKYLNKYYDVANKDCYIILTDNANSDDFIKYNDKLPDGMVCDWVRAYK